MNFRDAFPLTPATFSIELSEPGDLTDSRPYRKRFNLRNGAEQLEMHSAMVPKSEGIHQRERSLYENNCSRAEGFE